MPALSLFEVQGDRVIGVGGDASDEVRSRFAKEAESLQARAHLIGQSIEMSAVVCAAVSFEGGSVAFRFAGSASDAFDVKGLSTDSGQCSCHGLIDNLA